MSFAGSTEDGLYWHVLCLNLENLSRGSRLTFCARFVALYFKIFTIFSSVVQVQNNSTGLSKPLRSQTISAAPIHTVSALPHNLWCICPGLSGLPWSNDIIENCINCRFWQGPRVTASTNCEAKPRQTFTASSGAHQNLSLACRWELSSVFSMNVDVHKTRVYTNFHDKGFRLIYVLTDLLF